MDDNTDTRTDTSDYDQIAEGEELNQHWTVDEDGVVSVAEDDDHPDLADNPDSAAAP
jgi:hypothetical protein